MVFSWIVRLLIFLGISWENFLLKITPGSLPSSRTRDKCGHAVGAYSCATPVTHAAEQPCETHLAFLAVINRHTAYSVHALTPYFHPLSACG